MDVSKRTVVAFIAITTLLVPLLGYGVYSGVAVEPWPPVGTRAEYMCGLMRGSLPIDGLLNYRGLYDEVLDFMKRELGYNPPEYLGDEPSMPVILDMGSTLLHYNLSVSCRVAWEVSGFNGTHYTIYVSIGFIILNHTVNEPVPLRELQFRIERAVLVDSTRNIIVDGMVAGTWDLFLLPWETAPGVEVQYSSLPWLPEGKDRLPLGRGVLSTVTEPSGQLMDAIKGLGLNFDRLLHLFDGVVVFSSALASGSGQAWPGYKAANMTIEELQDILKGGRAIVRSGFGSFLIFSTSSYYDTYTGILVYRESSMVPSDILVALGVAGAANGDIIELMYPTKMIAVSIHAPEKTVETTTTTTQAIGEAPRPVEEDEPESTSIGGAHEPRDTVIGNRTSTRPDTSVGVEDSADARGPSAHGYMEEPGYSSPAMGQSQDHTWVTATQQGSGEASAREEGILAPGELAIIAILLAAILLVVIVSRRV